MSYNGWTNRETWLVQIWFGDTFADMAEYGETVSAAYIEQFVADYVEEVIGRGAGSGFVQDMMDLGAIDYVKLAAHYATEPEVVEG